MAAAVAADPAAAGAAAGWVDSTSTADAPQASLGVKAFGYIGVDQVRG